MNVLDLWLNSPEIKAGRMISNANMGKLKAAMDALHEIMMAAEPPDPEQMMAKALTVREMFNELEREEINLDRLGGKHAS